MAWRIGRFVAVALLALGAVAPAMPDMRRSLRIRRRRGARTLHELSVMAYLLERVEIHAERLEASKVVAINLVVGERASIVDDSLLFAFDLLTPGTVAEGAKLNVRRTLMRFECPACAEDFHPAHMDFRCPRCGTVGKATEDGSELLIESLEFQT